MQTLVKHHAIRLGAVIATLSLAAPASAQDIGLAVHGGSLGLGADVAVQVHRNLGLRAGGNFFPFGVNFTASDVSYNLDLPSPQFMVLADLYPTGGFRISGGVMISSANFELTGVLDGPVNIGGTSYSPAEVGNLTGALETRDVSPYIGIGFGNPVSSRVGFFLDLGVAFHGSPQASVRVDGPISAAPGFQQDLDREIQDVQDDVESITVYPVLSVGFSIGFGR
jgi:hypothetical protein